MPEMRHLAVVLRYVSGNAVIRVESHCAYQGQSHSDYFRTPGTASAQLAPATSFNKDIGGDSLDIVEMVMGLEEAFGVTFSEADADTIKTVGDVIDYLARRKL